MPFNDEDLRRAQDTIARYPHARSALLPLLHIAQDRDGWVTPESMEQIAEMLVISIKTVERHRANILEKLGMRDRVELTRYAIKRGLVEP